MASDLKGFLQRTFGIGVTRNFEPSPGELKKLIEAESVTLLDIRSPREYERGHIPGAVPAPPALLDPEKLEVDREAPVVVYCASGGRSEYAKSLLERAGFTNVRNFGSVDRWEASLAYGQSSNGE